MGIGDEKSAATGYWRLRGLLFGLFADVAYHVPFTRLNVTTSAFCVKRLAERFQHGMCVAECLSSEFLSSSLYVKEKRDDRPGKLSATHEP